MRLFNVLIFMCLSTQLSANMQTRTPALNQQLKFELDSLRKQYGFPGASCTYVLPDGAMGVVVTGFADKEAERVMTPGSRMLAASIGKSFVAATVVALAKEGRLTLDDPLSKWLGSRPWFPRLPSHATITLWHLLTHSSGLLDHVYMKSFAQSLSDPTTPFSDESLVELVLDQPPLFEPGKGWSYTDTGYILLGLVIEAVTQNAYYKEVEERFLRSLDLDMTSPSNCRMLAGLAAGYTSIDNPFGLPSKTTLSSGLLAWNPAIESAGGGLVSTSRDLALWAKLLYEGRAMKVDYLNDLLRSVPVDKGESGTCYGAGVAIEEKGPLGPTWGHGGLAPGYTSSMRYYPKYRISIAFQINTDIGVWDHSIELVSDMEYRLAKIVVQHI